MDSLYVVLPPGIEERLLRIIDIRPAQQALQDHAFTPLSQLTIKRYHAIYDKLLAYGFTDAHCRNCLTIGSTLGHATLENSLQWLLTNYATFELPARMLMCPGSSLPPASDQGTLKGGVKVVSIANALHPTIVVHNEDPVNSDKGLIPLKGSKEGKEAAGATKADSKAWIQKYLEENNSDEDEYEALQGDPFTDLSEPSSAPGIDKNNAADSWINGEVDWDLWSDEREVSRP